MLQEILCCCLKSPGESHSRLIPEIQFTDAEMFKPALKAYYIRTDF